MGKKDTERIYLSVKEYIAKFSTEENPIKPKDVYKAIHTGVLKATRGYKNAWVIEVNVPVACHEYTTAEFVEEYNKKHRKNHIVVKDVRKAIEEGKLEAHKESGKWIITDSPSKRIK